MLSLRDAKDLDDRAAAAELAHAPVEEASKGSEPPQVQAARDAADYSRKDQSQGSSDFLSSKVLTSSKGYEGPIAGGAAPAAAAKAYVAPAYKLDEEGYEQLMREAADIHGRVRQVLVDTGNAVAPISAELGGVGEARTE